MNNKCCGNCTYFSLDKSIKSNRIGTCKYDIGDIIFPDCYQGAFGMHSPFRSMMREDSGSECKTYKSK